MSASVDFSLCHFCASQDEIAWTSSIKVVNGNIKGIVKVHSKCKVVNSNLNYCIALYLLEYEK